MEHTRLNGTCRENTDIKDNHGYKNNIISVNSLNPPAP